MRLGVKYTFPSGVYPRYSYLQGWTLKLLERFKIKIKKNHFEECVCQGYEELENIIEAGRRLALPEVAVFAQEKRLVPTLTKDLVQTFEPLKKHQINYKKITWKDFVKEARNRNDFDSKILVVIANTGNNVSTTMRSSLKQFANPNTTRRPHFRFISFQSEISKITNPLMLGLKFREMKDKLDQLPAAQQRNTFIYDPATKLHEIFNTFGIDDALPTKDVHSKGISFDIQSVLERKVVTLLQKMEAYMEQLVPRESMDPGKSLLDDIKDTIENLEICCLKEIFFKSDNTNESTIKYRDTDTHGRCLIVISSSKKRRRRKKKKKRQVSKSQNRKSKDSRSPRQIWIDGFFSEPVTMAKGTELIDLFERRVRCQMIDNLSKRYGIHPMVTTTFLTSDKFFYFEDKFGHWIRKEQINKLESIEKILDTCKERITDLVLNVEQFVKDKYEELEGIQRQHFELYGILRQTNYDVKIRELTRLDPSLQDELLRVREVTGCGTIYGILTLHASEELSESSTEKIKVLLRQYNYFKGYKVNVVSSKVEQAGNNIEIDNGTPFKAECTDSDQSKYGTLGCFVDVTSHSDDRHTKGRISSPPSHKQQAQSRMSSQSKDGKSLMVSPNFSVAIGQQLENLESKLHCVTCCHCVKDCNPEIKTKHGDKVFAEKTDYFIESGDRYDIALLKVHQNEMNSCIKKLWMRVDGDDKRQCWDILSDSKNLASRPVFKYGGISRYTCGVIASDDYKEQRITETREKRGTANPDLCLDPTINVIIVGSESTKEGGNNQEQDSQSHQEVPSFSTDGDSGSIICDTDINNSKVIAISILHGALTRGKKWLCTYSALLRQSFDELEKRFNISIKIPEIEEFEESDNPFALVEEDFELDQENMETDSGPQGRDQVTDQVERMEMDGESNGEGNASKAEVMCYKPSGLVFSEKFNNLGSRQQNLRQCQNFTNKKE